MARLGCFLNWLPTRRTSSVDVNVRAPRELASLREALGHDQPSPGTTRLDYAHPDMATSSTAAAIVLRLDALVQEGDSVPESRTSQGFISGPPMSAWRTRSIAFLQRTLGPADPYTLAFVEETKHGYTSSRDSGVAILKNLRADVEGGYLNNIYLGIAGEVLSDLLDLAAWALDEGSKEAGAILIGSGLEVGLRRIATARNVNISAAKGIEDVNKALCDAGAYGPVRRGQVDAWRLLRNKAIHGEHAAYSDAEVRLMVEGVRTFLAEELR